MRILRKRRDVLGKVEILGYVTVFGTSEGTRVDKNHDCNIGHTAAVANQPVVLRVGGVYG